MNLLGVFEIFNDQGRSITPGPRKLRVLIALFCAHAGTALSSQQLYTALWPKERPRTVITALQVHISRVRKHLSASGGSSSSIVTCPPGYLLDDPLYEIDAHSFEALTEEADQAEARGDVTEAVDLLQRALALRRGPALADLRSLPALDAIGCRLDEQMLAAFGRKTELELRLGRHARLLPELFAMAAENPLHEHIHRLLMVCLYRSGRAAEALSTYAQLRNALVESVGLEPSAETQRLQRQILRYDPGLDNAHSVAL